MRDTEKQILKEKIVNIISCSDTKDIKDILLTSKEKVCTIVRATT